MSKGHLDLILDRMSEAVLQLSAGGRIVYANPAALQLIQIPEERLLGSRLGEVIGQASWDQIARFIDVTSDCPKTLAFDTPLTLNGRHLSVQVVFMEDQLIQVVILNDITEQTIARGGFQKACDELELKVKERTMELLKAKEDLEVEIQDHKRTVEALRRSEEQYRDMVENLNDVIFATDENGILTYISPSVESITGYRPSEVMGRHFSEFICADDLPRITEMFQRILSGHLEASEYRVAARSGKAIWVRSSSRPLQRDGRVIGLRGILTDITGDKRLRQQLEEVQRMEVIGRFSAGLAHEMKNLMSAALSYSRFLLDDLPEGDQRRDDVKKIKEAGEKAVSLISQLLALGPDHIANPGVLNLNEIVTGMTRMLGSLMGKEVRIKTMLDPELGLIDVDQGHLEQTIMNLAVNAKDAMPEGGTLIIETRNVELDESWVRKGLVDGAGAYVLLAVTDTGVGIEGETLSRIFEPFFTTKAPGKGTGLGLSTAYGTVKRNRGYISVRSRPQKGATFRIYLPRVEDRACLLHEFRDVP